jgi:nucleotide-binding universal stress UspA family protein
MSTDGPADRNRVVVGFDGSDESRRALEWGAEECELRRCALVVVHADRWSAPALALPVFGEEEIIEEDILDEGLHLVRMKHPTVDVRGERLAPPAGESLVAASEFSSLLVVGSRGEGHVQQMILGSVSRYCVEHARCPVVVVH